MMKYYRTCSCSGNMVQRGDDWVCQKCPNIRKKVERKHNICHFCGFEHTHMPIYVKGGHSIQICLQEVVEAVGEVYGRCDECAEGEGYTKLPAKRRGAYTVYKSQRLKDR